MVTLLAMYQVEAIIPAILKDDITLALQELGALSVSEYLQGEDIRLEVLFHEIEEFKQAFDKELYKIKKFDPNKYQNEWFKHYKAFPVSKDVLIKPYTDKKKYPQKYQLVLDPRQAFGDGRHPTTKLTLQTLEKVMRKLKPESVLDVGAGTGVLAILANKLGAKKCLGFDYDKLAVKSAQKNNWYSKTKCKFFVADAFKYTDKNKYELILINMISSQMEKALPRVVGMLNSQGIIIASGISTRWTKELEKFFRQQGLKVVSKAQLEGWNCFVLAKQ